MAGEIAKEPEFKNKVATPSAVLLMEFGKNGGDGAVAPNPAEVMRSFVCFFVLFERRCLTMQYTVDTQ